VVTAITESAVVNRARGLTSAWGDAIQRTFEHDSEGEYLARELHRQSLKTKKIEMDQEPPDKAKDTEETEAQEMEKQAQEMEQQAQDMLGSRRGRRRSSMGLIPLPSALHDIAQEVETKVDTKKEKGRKLGDELVHLGDDQLIPGVGSVHKLVELAGAPVDLAKITQIPEYRKIQNIRNPSSRFHGGPQEDEEDCEAALRGS